MEASNGGDGVTVGRITPAMSKVAPTPSANECSQDRSVVRRGTLLGLSESAMRAEQMKKYSVVNSAPTSGTSRFNRMFKALSGLEVGSLPLQVRELGTVRRTEKNRSKSLRKLL